MRRASARIASICASGKLIDAQQRMQLRLHWSSSTRSINSTLSEPSVSCNFTSMISLSVVWMVRPTKAASIGQFAMATINQHAKLNAARTAMIEQCVQRRSRGPSGVEHVVHQDDVLVLDIELHGALFHLRAMANGGEIVAIKRDVEKCRPALRFFRCGPESSPAFAPAALRVA